MRTPLPAIVEAEQSPAAWFVMLEIARAAGDPDRERQALRELRKLGVIVQYLNRPIGPGVIPNG